MKRSRSLAMAVLVAAMGAAWAQAPDLSKMDVVQKSVPDGPVAKVFDATISAEDFLSLYAGDIQQLSRSRDKALSDVDRVKAGLMALRQLVEREILYSEAIQKKVSIADDDLQNAYIQEMEAIRRSMSQEKGKELTEDEVLKHAGATRDQALADLRKSLVIEKWRLQLIKEADITVDPKEVQKAFDEYKGQLQHPDLVKLNHFLAKFDAANGLVTNEAKQKAKTKAEEALKRIQSGQSFNAVAKAMSDAPGAQNGGLLDTRPVSTLPPFYLKPLQSMKPGDISQPIESEFGYHIIQLIEWTPAGETNFDEVRTQIENRLKTQRGLEAVSKHCQEIIAKNADKIEVYLQLEKVLANHPDFQADASAPPSVPGNGKDSSKGGQ